MTAGPSGGAEAGALRRAAFRLGLQTAVAVTLVVLALEAVALVVVLRSQHAAELDLLQQMVARADDVSDPPVGTWLTIRSPSRLVSSPGLPAGFPLTSSLDAAVGTGTDQTGTTTTSGRDYLVYTKARGKSVVQGVLDLSADHAERNRLVAALSVSGALGLVLAAVAGVFLAGRAMKPIASALALQRRFVADASHELRTPLTLLSTRAQLVRRDLRGQADPAALAREVDGLVTDASNLAQVLEDLLLTADPRSARRHEPVDVGRLAQEVAAAAAASARTGGVTVRCRVEEGAFVVDASPTALRRAITALVDNAVRHARTEATVSIHSAASKVVIEVTDDGAGIQPDLLPRLFERFESSDPTGSTQRSYGLGLALVSEVASRHGGTVTARNREQPADGTQTGGAVLELSIPRRR